MKRLILGVAVAWLVCAMACAQAGVITFDDYTTGPYATIDPAQPYHGFTWDNFWVMNKDTFPYSGWAVGAVSGNYTAYNGYGFPALVSDTAFTFNGVYLTSVYDDPNSVTVTGSLGGVQKYTQTVVLSTSGPTWVDFNFVNIDTLQFSSSIDRWFCLDNFTFDEPIVPEPSSLILWSLAVGVGMTVTWWRRKRAA
jgi:PEP-CTERM motif